MAGPLPALTNGVKRFKPMTTPCEWVECYRPGGYHPVHLGDQFNHGQYHVIRKLGAGSFSTVWLVIDTMYVFHCSLVGDF
jgi:serine/threonine protein kinase